ncbi:MAG TPA: hypothetical protein VLS94_08940 [Fusibacter sp.]|nr:hypothetical protein [Fusibacter sp.]
MSISQILHDKFMSAMVGRDDDNKFLNIDVLHQKVHEGKMLFTSHVFLAVANGVTVYVRHTCGSTKYLHSQVDVRTVGQWTFTSYAGTTYSVAGTIIPILNRKSDSAYVPETVFRHTPTINVLGTPRLSFTFGTGTNPAQVNTGTFNDRLESLFAPNTDVLIGLKNESGAPQYLSIQFDFYEDI